MKIEYKINYSMEVDKCNIDYLTAVFKQLLVMVFTDFVKTVLEQFAEDFMKMEKKPFHCSCGNDKNFIWKTKDAKPMKITSIFAELILPQMQIQCKACRKKMFISRLLLGIGKDQKMSLVTQRILAFIGCLTTFRVSEKILGMFGVAVNRMKVWRCVQNVGKTISFDLDPKQLPCGEADGDTSIFKGVKCLNVILQRCLWHIPHQLKHCLWSDGVKRKSAEWLEIMGKIFDISSIRPHMEKDEIVAVLKEKRTRLDGLISFCIKQGHKACASYLLNARPDMSNAIENRLNGKSSSLVERVMRTVNLRVNVGKWSPSGALNAMNLRLAHYYNGWEPYESEIAPIDIQRL